jgi:hypothetical protein
MAHIRRKFEKALDNDKERATYVLTAMQGLYTIERKAREQAYSQEQRKELRQQEALPIMDELKAWLLKNRDQILPKSSIGEAINYACNRWKYMEFTFFKGTERYFLFGEDKGGMSGDDFNYRPVRCLQKVGNLDNSDDFV